MRRVKNAIENFNGKRRTVDERRCFLGLDSRSMRRKQSQEKVFHACLRYAYWELLVFSVDLKQFLDSSWRHKEYIYWFI